MTNSPFSNLSYQALLSIALGVLAFFATTGGAILIPTNVDWIRNFGGDPLTYWLGWSFFRYSPLIQWPLGANPSYGIDISSSIVFTDSIPLLAFFFKLLSPILPEQFQYLGLWILCCFCLQSYFGWKTLSLFSNHKWLPLIGSQYLMIAPVFIYRLEGHYSLLGQWVILVSIYLYFLNRHYLHRWLLLILATELINAYLLVMVLAIFVAEVAQRTWIGQSSWRKAAYCGLGSAAIVIVVALIAGYFSLGTDVNIAGFGIFRMNLLGFFDSGGYWSIVLPNLFVEGPAFNFLGLGALVLLVIAGFHWIISGRSAPKSSLLALCITAILFFANGFLVVGLVAFVFGAIITYLTFGGYKTILGLNRAPSSKFTPLLIVSLALILLAVSNRVALGRQELLEIELPTAFDFFTSSFRSSGRFFWPVYYLLYIGILVLIMSRFAGRTALAILLVVLLVQMVDYSKAWEGYREEYMRGATWITPLRSSVWQDFASHYKNIRFVTPGRQSEHWRPLAEFAAAHRMAINTGRFSRTNWSKVRESKVKILREIAGGEFDPDSLYIFETDAVLYYVAGEGRPTDAIGLVDGIPVLAPNLSNCGRCSLGDIKGLPKTPGGGFEYAGGRIGFGATGSGKKYAVYGWSAPEPGGTWSDGDFALVAIAPDKFPFGDLELLIEGATYITSRHPTQAVEVTINGYHLETLEYGLESNAEDGIRIVRIPRTLAASNNGRVHIRFDFPNAVSPKMLGRSPDRRLLGLALVSLELKPVGREQQQQ